MGAEHRDLTESLCKVRLPPPGSLSTTWAKDQRLTLQKGQKSRTLGTAEDRDSDKGSDIGLLPIALFFSFYNRKAVWRKANKQYTRFYYFIQTDFREVASRYDIEMNKRISELIKMKRRENQARQGLCIHRW